MKNDDIDNMLSSMDLPAPENIKHQQELKVPLLSYKRSSRMGLLLLILPVIAAITGIIKYELVISSPFLDAFQSFFAAIDKNKFFTYLIPIIFMGLPLFAMIINFLSFCHFAFNKENKELLITIKYRPFNIAVFIFSFAVIVFFLLPDRLSF